MKTWLTRNFSDRYWWFSREYKGIRKELKRTLWEPNKCHKTEISILLTDAFGNCKIKMSWNQLWTIKKFFLSIYEYIYIQSVFLSFQCLRCYTWINRKEFEWHQGINERNQQKQSCSRIQFMSTSNSKQLLLMAWKHLEFK